MAWSLYFGFPGKDKAGQGKQLGLASLNDFSSSRLQDGPSHLAPGPGVIQTWEIMGKLCDSKIMEVVGDVDFVYGRCVHSGVVCHLQDQLALKWALGPASQAPNMKQECNTTVAFMFMYMFVVYKLYLN